MMMNKRIRPQRRHSSSDSLDNPSSYDEDERKKSFSNRMTNREDKSEIKTPTRSDSPKVMNHNNKEDKKEVIRSRSKNIQQNSEMRVTREHIRHENADHPSQIEKRERFENHRRPNRENKDLRVKIDIGDRKTTSHDHQREKKEKSSKIIPQNEKPKEPKIKFEKPSISVPQITKKVKKETDNINLPLPPPQIPPETEDIKPAVISRPKAQLVTGKIPKCSRIVPIKCLSFKKRDKYYRAANANRKQLDIIEETLKDEERQNQKFYQLLSSFKGANSDLISVELDTKDMKLNYIRFEKSKIEGFGVKTTIPIRKGEKVIEYIGEVIRPIIADKRQINYEKMGNHGTYVFKADSDHYLDATFRGGIARWINHSCDPNCESRIIKLNGRFAVVLVAIKDINPCEELTYDYKLPYEPEDKAIKCLCGSPNCRGWLNRDKNTLDDKTFSEVKFKNISEDVLLRLVENNILPIDLFKADGEFYVSHIDKDGN